MTATVDNAVADLQRANAELQRRLDEALDQQTATAEVLQVINSSPGDLGPVFDAMLEKAMRLCEAAFGLMFTIEGESTRIVAERDMPKEFSDYLRAQPPLIDTGSFFGRAVLERSILHTADLTAGEFYRQRTPLSVASVDLGGVRALLMAPLVRDDVAIGVFAIFRREAKPFTDKQIALLENFAAQAVIAIENARLITETREALEQQTATAEVLQVINSSPGDLAPVFDAMLDKAARLCEAVHGQLAIYDGEFFRFVAAHGEGGIREDLFARGSIPPSSGITWSRIVSGQDVVHVPDVRDTDLYRTGHEGTRRFVDVGGGRSLLSVALRKENTLIVVLSVYRQHPRPFSDKQIALLQNFAAQAVIAMENARLITETREALEQQTATAEVLQVINSSPGDLAPVFDAILEKAHLVCGAALGSLIVLEGDHLRAVATRGYPNEYARLARKGFPARPFAPFEQLQRGQTVHLPDLSAVSPSQAITRAAVEIAGVRTILMVPLRKDDVSLGYISAQRQEVRPFTDKQIALLQNFAAQAVIAMENARLITETREALERQTATAEVLQVINSSPGDLAPVFDAMLDKALQLCSADFGTLQTHEGGFFETVAATGDPGFVEQLRSIGRFPMSRGVTQERIAKGARVVHLSDILEDPVYVASKAGMRTDVEAAGIRTLLSIALRKDDDVLGQISVYRKEVRPFTDKQIALLQNFAAQAVIAMENARLLTETREALDQQTATAEVLQVINSSPGDLTPVFDSMLDKALRLCEAVHGVIRTYDGRAFHEVARSGESSVIGQLRELGAIEPTAGNLFEPLVSGERLIHIADIAAEIDRLDPDARKRVEATGARTWLAIALHKEGLLFGAILVYRQEVRPFSDKQIALLQNFAAQAVIAIENARLITETREALEQQTATAEVLQVINSSPGDLAPVFDAILEKGHTLCGATQGALLLYDGSFFRPAASRGLVEAFAERLKQGVPAAGNPVADALLAGGHFVQIPNMANLEDPIAKVAAEINGTRTLLAVPLRKDGALLGAIIAYRTEVRLFTDKQIALLQNFAAQAVIAMENARLITETREALEQQTATAEVLGVINSSPGDLAPVFDAMLDKATTLCGAAFGILLTYDGERFHDAALKGVSEEYAEYRRRNPPVFLEGSSPVRILRGENIVHHLDIQAEEAYQSGQLSARALVEQGGVRTLLAVALRHDETLLGTLSIYRQEVRPFSDKQIALLQNFAAQAVIAIENARLIAETREALEKQTAMAEILRVISGSPTDVQPTFEAIAASAMRICGAATGAVLRFDGTQIHLGAQHGTTQAELDDVRRVFPIPPGRSSASARAILTREIQHILDPAADPEFTHASLTQFGTLLSVPMLRDGAPLGAITVTRKQIEPFSEAQIEILRTFADQAVIAIENVRLFNELNARTRDLQESLEYQTATSDVLQVISRSTFDLQPILDTLLQSAARLCDTESGMISTRDGEAYRAQATLGADSPEQDRFLRSLTLTPGRGSVTGRTLLERRIVHVPDIAADPEYAITANIEGGFRASLGVPLLREDEPIGVLILSRRRAEAFTEQQIELVRTFADQAVIAIENTRLLTELRESLEQQQAMAEVLGVINANPGNLQPVFDAMLERALRLCEADQGTFWTFAGERFYAVANRGFDNPSVATMDREGVRPTPNFFGRLVRGETVIHILDVAADPDYLANEVVRARVSASGSRSVLLVALCKDDRLLGAISTGRRELKPFSDKQIALLQNFAAQAVIAMDNARLLDEIRQRQAELRVTFDNMGDGVAMFDAELRLAAWNRNFQQILDLPDEFVGARPSYGEYARLLAERGEFGAADVEAEVRRLSQVVGSQGSLERTRPDGRVIEVRYNPAPAGGFVLMYGDITERRRAEEAVRAARDAAEKALAELRATQQQLVVQQKMAALGQLTAGIAHEIKNPLNFVNNFANLSVELLGELKETTAPAVASLGEDKRAEVDETIVMLTSNLEKIAEHGKRADNIVKSMLEHSRGVAGERREVDLNNLIEEALNLAYHGARAQDESFNIILERDYASSLTPIEVAPQEITRVFLNLFGNGFYAANKRSHDNGDGSFRPTLIVGTRDIGDAVEVTVRDNGTGIAPEIRDKLFQPFVTTKPTGEGTGLGLSISYGIVAQQHGGTITVDSCVGEFTEFTIRLPRAYRTTSVEAAS
jgi:GAF domain-containing protein